MPSFSPLASQKIPVVYVLFVPYVPSLRADLGRPTSPKSVHSAQGAPIFEPPIAILPENQSDCHSSRFAQTPQP